MMSIHESADIRYNTWVSMISLQTKNYIAGFIGASILTAIALVITHPTKSPLPTNQQVLGERTTELGGAEFRVPETLEDSSIDAKSYIAFDLVSGEVLAAKAPTAPVPIASLTKLMTGLLAIQSGLLNDSITINSKDTISITPVLGLQTGDKVSGLDLFNAMIIGSANDAALTLGNQLAEINRNPIGQQMTEQAQQLGMTETHFDNPIGFDSDANYSTAADLKLLVQAVTGIKEFLELRHKTGYSFTTTNGRQLSVRATNRLIGKHPEIEAIKTGYTEEARGAMATSFSFTDRHIAIIVLNSNHREADTLKIKDQIIRQLTTVNPPAQP